MHGLQLWVNLPAKDKLTDPAYRHLPAETIPVLEPPSGGRVKVIAGTFADGENEVRGPARGIATDPLYLDIQLPAGTALDVPIPMGHRALVYLISGRLDVVGQPLRPRQMAVLGKGGQLSLRAAGDEARALLMAARPLDEPIVHQGPFVMNTREEIKQAIRDYELGQLAA